MSKYLFIIFMLITTLSYGGVACDGVDDSLTCGNDASVQPESFTIIVWLNRSGTSSATTGIVDMQNTPDSAFTFGWNAFGTGVGKPYGFVQCSSGTDCLCADNSGTATTVGVWHMLTMTYDDSAPEMDIWLDKVSGQSNCPSACGSCAGSRPNYTGASALRIGSRRNDSGAFNGVIGNVCMWSSVLTDAQIESYYDAKIKGIGMQFDNANFIDCWLLDDEPDGASSDGDTFRSMTGVNSCTGVDGSNNTGLTAEAEGLLTYP